MLLDVVAVACTSTLAASPIASTLAIDGTPQHTLSPTLYSLFFETEINFGGEGGVYAELVANRDFETLGRGRIPSTTPSSSLDDAASPPHLDPREPAAIPTDFRPWASVHGATISIDNMTAPFGSNPNSLKVVAAAGGLIGAGASNPGYWGIAVRPHISYNLTLYGCSSTAGATLRLSAHLTTADGSTVLATAELQPTTADPTAPVMAPGWVRFKATLKSATSLVQSAALEIVLADDHQDGTYWLDGVSLIPSDAVGDTFRRDALERLRDLKPGFMRTPGGNYLEGTGMRTRWDWKATLGPPAARRGHYNSAWGYWVTDGLGVYELLSMCELLNSTCQMSVYTGYSMGRAYVPMNESEQFAQDAVDMLDFANGAPASSKYVRRTARFLAHYLHARCSMLDARCSP